jgi:aspartyl-tRNA synthetase
VFRSVVDQGGTVRGISFVKGAGYSRKQIAELEKIAKDMGAGGLATVKITEQGVTSPIAKFIDDKDIAELKRIFDVRGPALVLLVAGPRDTVSKALGALRNHLGRLGLAGGADTPFNFLWVNRFPIFSEAEEGGWEPTHHIFSMPLEEDIEHLETDPGRVRGHLYDLVCNGTELGSGSIRIHHRELQETVFGIIGIGTEEAERKFGFLLEAFEYGAPPHGGVALGLDRIATVIGGGASIRDYIAFPKTQSATSLMEGAPSEVEREVLEELHIRVVRGSDEER